MRIRIWEVNLSSNLVPEENPDGHAHAIKMPSLDAILIISEELIPDVLEYR